MWSVYIVQAWVQLTSLRAPPLSAPEHAHKHTSLIYTSGKVSCQVNKTSIDSTKRLVSTESKYFPPGAVGSLPPAVLPLGALPGLCSSPPSSRVPTGPSPFCPLSPLSFILALLSINSHRPYFFFLKILGCSLHTYKTSHFATSVASEIQIITLPPRGDSNLSFHGLSFYSNSFCNAFQGS